MAQGELRHGAGSQLSNWNHDKFWFLRKLVLHRVETKIKEVCVLVADHKNKDLVLKAVEKACRFKDHVQLYQNLSGGWDAVGPPFLQCFCVFSKVLQESLGMAIWGHPDHKSPFPSKSSPGLVFCTNSGENSPAFTPKKDWEDSEHGDSFPCHAPSLPSFQSDNGGIGRTLCSLPLQERHGFFYREDSQNYTKRQNCKGSLHKRMRVFKNM